MLQNTNCLLAINNYYYSRGGADVLFLEHNRMMERIGWQVVPFAMRHPKNLATPWSDYFPDEIEFGSSYSLGDKLMRAPRVIYSMQARRNMSRLLDAIDPSIAHVHNIYHHLSPSFLTLVEATRNSRGHDRARSQAGMPGLHDDVGRQAVRALSRR